ncbi:MAG: DMT family transporter [Phycisphaerae bacterium]
MAVAARTTDPSDLHSPPPPASGARSHWLWAVCVLCFCCVLWGWSFPVIQLGVKPFDAALKEALHWEAKDLSLPLRLGLGAAFNAIRLGLAALVYALLARHQLRGFNRAELLGGFMVGTFYAGGMLGQTIGLSYTVPSISGFLTALLVVFAPLAQALLLRRPVGKIIWLAVVIALIGMAILSWPTQNTAPAVLAGPWPWFGEAFTVLGALLFTGQILSIDRFGARANPIRMTLVMFTTTAVISGLASLALGCGPLYTPAALTSLACNPTVWWTMGSLIILSSIVALHLMNAYQPRVSPATASVIYCMEPLCAVFFSLAFQTETLTTVVIVGGAIILAAVLLVAAGERQK